MSEWVGRRPSIDTRDKKVSGSHRHSTFDRESLPYDRLLIATGASPIVPGLGRVSISPE